MIEIAKNAINRTTLDINPHWLEKELLARTLHAFDLFAYLRFNIDLTAIADCRVFVSRITVDIGYKLTRDGVNADVILRKHQGSEKTHTSSKRSFSSAVHLPSLRISQVAQMPASPDSMLAAVDLKLFWPFFGTTHCF